MKNIRYLLLFFLMACSSTKVVYDYDVKTNFNTYKTFSFFEDVGAGLNNLDVNRLISILETELIQLGFQKAELPDFYINFSAKKEELRKNENVSVGIGSGGGNVGFGIFGGIPIGGKKLLEKIKVETEGYEKSAELRILFSTSH